MHGRRLATTEELIAVVSPDCDDTVNRLREWAIDRDRGLEVVPVGQDVGDVYDENRPTLGITIGGDGTFFEGIKTFAPRGVPLLGINRGTLSFLARVEPSSLEDALDEVLRGRATVDSRQQVHVSARGLDSTGINDVMIQHVPPENPVGRKVTTLDVFIDGEYVGEFEGTGLAVSTPTGSTGISLSANGPVHYPVNNETLQLVPLHTHQLGVRPVVMAASAEIRIFTGGKASLLVDGGRAHTLVPEDEEIVLTGAERPAYVVRTSFDDHFFTAITKKLGWDLRTADGVNERDRRRTAPARPTSTSDDVEARALVLATEAAWSAGELLRELHGHIESVAYKTDKADLVTEADHRANRIITTTIENEFPDHGILSEESGMTTGSEPYTWVVDPLDGTGNFAHGNPNYAVSVALVKDRVPVVGVVYVPETDELFKAVRDEPAYENGVRLMTTARDRLDESMLLSGYDPDGSFLVNFYQEARGVRRLGATALNLCFLASGSADATWEYDTHPWDVAAGLVIARAAGATITDASGDPFEFDFETSRRKELLGSNGPLHPVLLDHLDTSAVDLE